MISVTTAMLGRRSTRAFLSRPVPESEVRDIIDVARRAPSGGNLQPWRLIVMAGDDLTQFKAAVQANLKQNPRGDGPEFPVYPNPLKEPFDGRRKKCGEDMYAAIGVTREDRAGRLQQFARNYDFFGAPVGMILAIDRSMETAQWTDIGIFLQSILLLAYERGLATCAQASWAAVHKTIRAHLGLSDDMVVICGISLGYPDLDHPINSATMDREPVGTVAELRGFANR